MTSKIVVNNIEADAGISTVTFNNEVTAPTFNGNIVGTAATFSGNVDIAGALTYEDVTNVDSVGVVTARSGIHVTGGSVGIGQTNPQGDLHIGNINGSKNLIMHSANQGNARIRFREGGSIASGFNEYSIGMVGLNNALTVEGQGAGEIIRIMGDTGLVGIGTDAPANKLSISDPGYTGIELQSDRTTATDNIGGLHFRTLSTNVAYIQSLVDGTVRIRNTSSLTERFRITSDGKIGVNNNAPLYAMHFKNAMSSSPSFVHMEVTGSNAVGGGGGIAFDTSASNALSNNGLYLATISGVRNSADDGSNDLVFKTSKSGVAGDDGNTHSPKERLRITSDGSVGIGTNDPSLTGTTIGMHIAGGNAALKLQNTNNGDWAFIEYADESNTTRYVQGYRDSSGVYSIRPGTSLNATPGITLDSNGNVGIHETNPARQLSVYHASNSGVEIKSNTDGQSSVFFTDTADGNIGMVGYTHNNDEMFFRVNDQTRLTINSSGYVGINATSPSDRLHVKGAILQQGYSDGAVVRSSVMVASFGAGTHNIFTCTATGVDNSAVATMEYVSLFAYSGSNHYAGIKLASTRRSGNNTSWTNIPNVNAAGSGNDSSIQPNLFFQNGVLMVTIPGSVQVTATVRITTRSFTLVRNYSAG